jgi:hypothetical protein
MFSTEGRKWRCVENRPKQNQLVEPTCLLPIATNKIVTSPMTMTTPKAKYDHFTSLGIATKAMTAGEFDKLPLKTIPFSALRPSLALHQFWIEILSSVPGLPSL